MCETKSYTERTGFLELHNQLIQGNILCGAGRIWYLLGQDFGTRSLQGQLHSWWVGLPCGEAKLLDCCHSSGQQGLGAVFISRAWVGIPQSSTVWKWQDTASCFLSLSGISVRSKRLGCLSRESQDLPQQKNEWRKGIFDLAQHSAG